MKNFMLLKLVYIAVMIKISSSSNPSVAMNLEKASINLNKILFNYRKEVVPIYENKPVNVSISMYINDMVPLENIPKHFSVDFTLRMIWEDKRLVFEDNSPEAYVAFDAQVASQIWIPNIYFPKGKRGVMHDIIAKNVFILVYKNGTVKYSQRLSVLSFCPMKFRLYPFDIQDCSFELETFAQSELYVNLKWMDKPIDRKTDLNVPDYSNVKIRTNSSTRLGDFGLNFTTLEVKFTLHRDFTLHFLRDFFPCILTVMLSWVSFYLSYKSTPARSTFGITTVLTIVTMSNNIRSTAPSSKTFRSLDYYMLICMIFVFGALVEFAVVGITDPDFSPRWKNKGKRTKKNYDIVSVKEPENKGSEPVIKKIDIGPFVLITGDQHVIDNCAKIVFPLLFLFVNAVYFAYHRIHPETVNK
ncbi:glycine receptor subunit alpha-2 isoform X3 [Hydra vulgaris]|uniref:Glycine receptor subunit alpha-2 isoform X3 n=2 Tax=Hydra vulgaris TaxID=6087 RepID=A0ABM4C743_HYDVU